MLYVDEQITSQVGHHDTKERFESSSICSSPKYALLWFIPMIDLFWSMPQTSSDDTNHTGGKNLSFFSKFNSTSISNHLDELKSHLKSAYKELEKSSNVS